MDWYSDCKRISKQEVRANVAKVEWFCQLQDIQMFAFSWMDGGHASSAFVVPISVTHQWHVRLDAGCCGFLVYRLVTDKAVQRQPNFRLSLRSRVFRCLFCGWYKVPGWLFDISQVPMWCFSNSISCLEILLQSEYQSIPFQWNA